MRWAADGKIDRSGWPTKEEIQNYLDPGYGGSPFMKKVCEGLRQLHELADRLDQWTEASEQGRMACLEHALQFYANRGKWNHWGGTQDHWCFNPMMWGSSEYWAEPPRSVQEAPWLVAEYALKKGAIPA